MEDNTWQEWGVLVKFRNRLEELIIEDEELAKLAYEYFCVGGDLERACDAIGTIQKQKWSIGSVFARQDGMYKGKMELLLKDVL